MSASGNAGNSALHKLNIRNVLSLIFSLGFFAVLGAHIFIDEITIPDILLGAMIVQITLIVQFFFRRGEPQ